MESGTVDYEVGSSRIDGIGLVWRNWNGLGSGNWNWNRNWNWNSKGRTGPEQYSVGVDHQPTQASQRMGTLLNVSSTGVHLGTELDPARKYSLGNRERWWIPVELVSKVVRPWNSPGYSSGIDHQPTQASQRMGTLLHVSSTGVYLETELDPVGHQTENREERCGNQKSGFPRMRIKVHSRAAAPE